MNCTITAFFDNKAMHLVSLPWLISPPVRLSVCPTVRSSARLYMSVSSPLVMLGFQSSPYLKHKGEEEAEEYFISIESIDWDKDKSKI